MAIRIQALGDLFACMPILSALKKQNPDTQIDLLCREDFAELPASLDIFHTVHHLKGGTSGKAQLWHAMRMFPMLKRQGYDLVLDLQRNRQSRLIRKLLRPIAFSEFDRLSPKSPLLRYRWSVEQAGFQQLEPNYDFVRAFRPEESAMANLRSAGWQEGQSLVILNPAGLNASRNWPIENYGKFMDNWLKKDANTLFMILGTSVISERAGQIHSHCPEYVINLVGQTNLREMYTLLLLSNLVLTEDSGLGHIAWLSGKKTVMMLGSTRADWTRPIGAHTYCFDSSHLTCGNCMQINCPLGTNACMTELTHEKVLNAAWTLFKS